MEQCCGSNECYCPNWSPPIAHHYKIFSQKSLCLFSLLSVRLRPTLLSLLFKVSSQTGALNMGLSMHRVLFGQCVCSFHELCVCVCVSCPLLPYGSCISPQCKHSWLPPVAAWVNSSLPADTKDPNRRITFTTSTLMAVRHVGIHGVLFVRDVSVDVGALHQTVTVCQWLLVLLCCRELRFLFYFFNCDDVFMNITI